jgi:hypothetical protein
VADDTQNALCALREATAALRQATDRGPVRDGGVDVTVLVADLARNLEALAALVRTAGHEALLTPPAGHDLQAVVQGISVTAAMARRAASPDGRHPAPHLAASGLPAATPDD